MQLMNMVFMNQQEIFIGVKMEFQLTVRFNAESEGEMAGLLQFIEDNYPAQTNHASADSESFRCHATIALASLAECIAAVGAFKAQFTISYKLEVKQ